MHTLTDYTTATVAIDTERDAYPALLTRGDWNGCVLPLFTRDTVNDMASDFDQTDGQYAPRFVWGENGELVVISCEGYADVYPPRFIDGVPYYPVGAGSWTWETV